MEEFGNELDGISKGNKTIVQAFHEIGVIKEAFERASRVEFKITQNQSAISDIKARMDLLSTSAYVDFKTEKLQKMIDTLVKTKFDEYASHLLIEISHKISDLEVKKLLDLKVNWSSFNEFKYTYGAIKLKLDSFIEADFNNYKIRVESELKKQREQIRENEVKTQSFLSDVQRKLSEVELKLEQVLAEEDPSVKDDQSEVDFDKMLGDLEKNIVKEDQTKLLHLKSAENTEKIKKEGGKDKRVKGNIRESYSPIAGFDVSKSERMPTEYFGSAVSPTYKKPGFDVLSRKSSITSTAGPGGLKQIGRKVMVLEKDQSEIFHEIRNFQKKFEKVEKDLKAIHDKIENINKRCDSIEENEKKLEQTFVHMLRAKDMQNKMKKNNVLVEKVPGNELLKLNKEISEKNKRIVQLDHYLKYIVSEVDYLKQSQNEKFRSFQESLNSFERDKRNQDKEVCNLKTNFSMIESGLSDVRSGSGGIEDSMYLKAPLTELMKERDFFGMKVRRKSQDVVGSLGEESKVSDRMSVMRNRRGMSATPKVSMQSKVVFVV